MKRHLLPAGAVPRARGLRRGATDAERMLWAALRESLPGARFRRQVPLGPYCADFVSHGAKLVIEVDGGGHARPDAREHDAERTRFLNSEGYRVLRFWNNQVLENLDGVLAVVKNSLSPLVGERLERGVRGKAARRPAADTPHPLPSPTRGEGELVKSVDLEFCLMPLLEARKQYKPFEYPWAFEYWKRQQQIHWMPEEVPLGEDCRDWAQKLTDHERNLLTQIFRFFTQADVEVQDCYHDKYGRVFKPTEIKMMLDRLLQHGDGAHRRLLAPARHDRHAGERIWRLPPV